MKSVKDGRIIISLLMRAVCVFVLSGYTWQVAFMSLKCYYLKMISNYVILAYSLLAHTLTEKVINLEQKVYCDLVLVCAVVQNINHLLDIGRFWGSRVALPPQTRANYYFVCAVNEIEI